MSLPHVIIHTDGACSGNPGPGGWGAILTFGDHEKELKGAEPHTTNNRMELLAAISALEALKNGLEEKDQMVESYNQRRRLIVQGLRDIGLECHEPQGAFYAFPSIASTGLSSEEFAQRLLLEAKVAAVPGNVFGAGGEGFLRCSYATGVNQLNEALNRMEQFVRKLKQG